MKRGNMRQRSLGGLVIACVGLVCLAAAPPALAGVASVTHNNTGLQFAPVAEFGSVTLRVSGADLDFEQVFLRGEPIDFDTSALADGRYNWSLVASPLRTLRRDAARQVRVADRHNMTQSGSFTIAGGLVANPDQLESVSSRDIQHLDDVIITFSLCVGNDCVNGESFGFDTVRLKENNVRIHFQDTSTSASFPTRDWRIVINDSSNGGGNYFAVEDTDAGTQPFRVDAGAGANALRVEAGGNVGLGNSNPVVELHVTDGDSPTLRLEQNGSSGFTAQTWDLAGNEANFFVRDVTGGSQLPFKIRPGADDNSLVIDNDNNIGIGILNAVVPLHVFRASGNVDFRLDGSSTDWTWRANQSNNTMTIIDSTNETAPFVLQAAAVTNLMQLGVNASNRVDITGSLFINGVDNSNPDYVFEPDYELESIEEHAEYMWREKHLPAVGAGRDGADGKAMIDVANRSQGMLEELEKAHIYIEQLHKAIASLESRLAAVEGTQE